MESLASDQASRGVIFWYAIVIAAWLLLFFCKMLSWVSSCEPFRTAESE